ncbi:hypothetical protein OROMI_003086 [Orobanche minor]
MASSDFNEKLYLANSKFESYDELLKNKFVKLQCDRGGFYRDRMCIGNKRKRNTGSRLIKCPFQIVGRKGVDGVWVLNAKNLTHNHEPCTDMSGHPSFRRLSPEDVESVKNMTLSGIAPRYNESLHWSISATMGLPCAHKINHLHGKPLPLDFIHPHWRIDTLRFIQKIIQTPVSSTNLMGCLVSYLQGTKRGL